MPAGGHISEAYRKLRDIIKAENVKTKARLERYNMLARKMTAFENGHGGAPTEEELSEWRDESGIYFDFRKSTDENKSP